MTAGAPGPRHRARPRGAASPRACALAPRRGRPPLATRAPHAARKQQHESTLRLGTAAPMRCGDNCASIAYTGGARPSAAHATWRGRAARRTRCRSISGCDLPATWAQRRKHAPPGKCRDGAGGPSWGGAAVARLVLRRRRMSAPPTLLLAATAADACVPPVTLTPRDWPRGYLHAIEGRACTGRASLPPPPYLLPAARRLSRSCGGWCEVRGASPREDTECFEP